jgi:hypothetical protein
MDLLGKCPVGLQHLQQSVAVARKHIYARDLVTIQDVLVHHALQSFWVPLAEGPCTQ